MLLKAKGVAGCEEVLPVLFEMALTCYPGMVQGLRSAKSTQQKKQIKFCVSFTMDENRIDSDIDVPDYWIRFEEHADEVLGLLADV